MLCNSPALTCTLVGAGIRSKRRCLVSVPDVVLTGMRETNDLFCTKAIRSRNMDVLDRVYTSDAHILPPGADMIQGLAGIKSFWLKAITGLDVKDASLATVSAESAGDTVVEIGRAVLTLASGQTVPVKYVVHWKRDGETWKWHTDIWNMNQ
jgi:ketosteroid isomerase-like protein